MDLTIYDNFTPLPADLDGWNGNSPAFAKLINKIRPKSIIEIGTWKGQSAINMGRQVKELGLDCKIYCVDTFLGALEFLGGGDPRFNLMRRHGYPQVYYQFLSNVVHAGLQDTIVPFPNTSLIAARYFKRHNITANLIYVDGSHDEADVEADLNAYRPLLTAGGVMFGDDYNDSGVERAIRRYTNGVFKLHQLDHSKDGCGVFWAFQVQPNSDVLD